MNMQEMGEGQPRRGGSEFLDEVWQERQQLLAILRKAVKERDDEPERYPVTPSCNECTEGSTPMSFDKGLCWYHRALRAIARAEGK